LDFTAFKRANNVLQLQPDAVIKHIKKILGKDTHDISSEQISWDNFSRKTKTLIPKTLTEKMTLFLKATVAEDISDRELNNYQFT